MSVIRVEKTKNYTVMSNYHLKESKMTLKAKGLLSLMLSLPDDWEYSIEGLSLICVEGIKGINSALKELEKFGYLKRNKIRNDKGIITDWEYCIYEKPLVLYPQVNEPQVDEGVQLNTYYINKLINKENIIKDFSDSPNQNLSSNNKLESFSTFDLENESPSSKYNCTNEGNNICSSSTVGEGNQTVSLDSGEKKISTYTINIVEHWNKLGEPKCTKITEELDKIVKKALKEYTEEEIKTAITNYKTVLHDKSYFFSYSWNIQKFLKQSNCLDDFTTQGEKWVNYCNQKGLNLDRNDTKKYETNENGVYSV